MAGHSAQGVVRVSRKPKTASETEIVRLITATNMSTPIGNFSQLVKDLASAGIVISGNQVAIKAKQTMVVDENNNTTALFANGKLNAALIDADTITVNHLYARKTNGGSVVGHFGNANKPDALIGQIGCPLWVGSEVARKAPFRVASDGSMYSVSGSIGGFAINATSIGSQTLTMSEKANMYMSKSCIIFNGNAKKTSSDDSDGFDGKAQASLGTNSLSATPMLYLESYQGQIYNGANVYLYGERSDGGSSNKFGFYANVTNGTDNSSYGYDSSNYLNIMYGFYAKRGNICADEGWIGGAKHTLLSLTATYTELDIRKNNVFIVANNSATSERRLVLPSRTTVNTAIGRTDGASKNPFCVKVFIVVHRSSRYGFHINARGISSIYDQAIYPYMYDRNGTKFSEHDMSPGDSAEFLLIYDGTEYYAQLTQINK